MMRPVSQHELKRVFSGRQFNKRLGLPGAEMKMLLVLRDRFIRVQRLIGVDQEMVVAGVRRLDSRGRDAHAREAELHPERTGDDIAVLRANATPAAASRGNVVLFCGLGNHVDLRGLLGGGSSPAKRVSGGPDSLLTGKITGNISIFRRFGHDR
jgi:hypothetical protein